MKEPEKVWRRKKEKEKNESKLVHTAQLTSSGA